MTELEKTQELFDFIAKGVSPFHVIHEVSDVLRAKGFVECKETDSWDLKPGNGYFVTRNDSSVIAFVVPQNPARGFQIMASHSDSPTFRIKENAELGGAGGFCRLNVERYGGMILSTWFDRPLSLAGRVMVQTENGVETRLYDSGRDLLCIPNLAIHMNRDVNDGHKFDVQKELMPLIGMEGFSLKQMIAKDLSNEMGKEILADDLLGMDISLYNRELGTVWGVNEEFCSAPRLDDLQCAFGSLQGLLAAYETRQSLCHIPMLAIFDNEEVGSTTKQGAESTFLADTLNRIHANLGGDSEAFYQMIAGSFMVSADNAHSIHPNYAEKYDSKNYPVANGGVVIKFNANQKYTSDAVSAAICKKLCQMAGVPFQTFANHSNQAGGSTLGNISNTQVSMNAVDIGMAQFAMHSAYESAGTKDTAYLVQFAQKFFETTIERDGGTYRLIG